MLTNLPKDHAAGVAAVRAREKQIRHAMLAPCTPAEPKSGATVALLQRAVAAVSRASSAARIGRAVAAR